jgi:uncharacterized protein with PIN domain
MADRLTRPHAEPESKGTQETPLCPACGSPVVDPVDPMAVPGPLPIAERAQRVEERCPECGSPLTPDLRNQIDDTIKEQEK